MFMLSFDPDVLVPSVSSSSHCLTQLQLSKLQLRLVTSERFSAPRNPNYSPLMPACPSACTLLWITGKKRTSLNQTHSATLPGTSRSPPVSKPPNSETIFFPEIVHHAQNLIPVLTIDCPWSTPPVNPFTGPLYSPASINAMLTIWSASGRRMNGRPHSKHP